MSRIDITLGLLAIMGVVAITALIGLGEESRMARDGLGWDSRRVESGAQLYEQYCSSCHGPNASGGICPPLDETSGLHGGDHGPGVAWRLEELGWDAKQPYEYVYSVIASGRTDSTRPDLYPGNKAEDPSVMSMPAWSDLYGGPLRPDQVADLTSYVVSFRDAVPEDATARPLPTDVPTEAPTEAPTDVPEAEGTPGEGTPTVEGTAQGEGAATEEGTPEATEEATEEEATAEATATP